MAHNDLQYGQKGEKYYHLQNYARAIEYFMKMTKNEKYGKIGSCYFYLKKYNEALEAFTNQDYVLLNCQNEKIIKKQFWCYILLKDWSQLATAYDEYIKNLDISNQLKQCFKAYYLYVNKKFDKAVEITKQLKDLEEIKQLKSKIREKLTEHISKYQNNIEDIKNKLKLSKYYLQREENGDLENAFSLLSKCLSQQEQNQRAYYYLGKYYTIIKNINEATTHFLHASNVEGDLTRDEVEEMIVFFISNGDGKNARVVIDKINMFKNLHSYDKFYFEGIINMMLKQFKTAEQFFSTYIIKKQELDKSVEQLIDECDMKIKESEKSLNSILTEHTSKSSEMNWSEGDYPLNNGMIKTEWEKIGNYYISKNKNCKFVYKSISQNDFQVYKDILTKIRGINSNHIVKYFMMEENIMKIEACKYGNLNDYLQKDENITLSGKIRIIKQINKGLKVLLDNSFPYIKLNPNNIFLYDIKKIKQEDTIEEEEDVYIKLGDFQEINRDKFYSKNNNWVSEINIDNIWYSFGLLIWQMLTNEIPFKELKNNCNSDDEIKEFLSKHHLSMKYIQIDTPASLYNVMMILLNKETNYRILYEKRNDVIHQLIDSIQYDEKNQLSKMKFEMSNFYLKINIFTETSSLQEISDKSLTDNYEYLIQLTDYDGPLLKYIGYCITKDKENWSVYSQKVDCTLTQYLKDNSITLEDKRNILIQIFDALTLIYKTKKNGQALLIGELNPNYIFVLKLGNNNIKIKIGNYGTNVEAIQIVFPDENKNTFPNKAVEFREFCLKVLYGNNYNNYSEIILQEEDYEFAKETDSNTLTFDTLQLVINRTWKKEG